ncbi:NTP/NDP exchange transporter [Chondromyces crocatus]|uniref:MFS transporter n=1 Tax=Chondromyces crocatus TaxID=52 RepID=A0A0K1EB52_CHOCO|nr:hypothetical protein [Chondromyces crocatus]AKT38085.1 MFS transporter [Chondromyces crocatus]
MNDTTSTSTGLRAKLRATLFGAEPLRPRESRSVFWGALVAFAVLGTWYFIRPVRDEIATRLRPELSSLTTATFVVMLVAMPLYAAVVKWSTPRRLVPGIYLGSAGMLVAFWLALGHLPEAGALWVERAFFVWSSVFSVFAISVLWALMADVFHEKQAKRFFGAIAAGGSLGGIVGSAAASLVLAPPEAAAFLKVSPSGMLLLAAGILVPTTLAVRGIHAEPEALGAGERGAEAQGDAAEEAKAQGTKAEGTKAQGAGVPTEEQPIRGTVWSSLLAPLRSPYLLAVCGYLFLYTITSTFLYFQQTSIVGAAIADKGERAALFARIDLVVNSVTFLAQLFLASHAMLRLGVGVTLCVVPVLTLLGFGVLTQAPVLSVVVGFQVVRRIANFSLSRPAREVLFTVVSREDKYKAKAFIDTVIYRGGDTLSAWMYTGFEALGLALSGLAGIAAALSGAWFAIAVFLGRSHARRSREVEAAREEGAVDQRV